MYLHDNWTYFTGINLPYHINVVLGMKSALIWPQREFWSEELCSNLGGSGNFEASVWFIPVDLIVFAPYCAWQIL